MGVSEMNSPLSSAQKEVLEMLMRLPAPPSELIPPGASAPQISACETRLGWKFPAKLRAWLLTCNGPCVGPGGVFGIAPLRKDLDIEGVLQLYPAWLTKGWIPIAGDGCGNYYVVAGRTESGGGEPVIFVDTANDDMAPAYIVGSDTWKFLRFLFKKELKESKWPFDREEVERADPEILAFHDLPLPWDI